MINEFNQFLKGSEIMLPQSPFLLITILIHYVKSKCSSSYFRISQLNSVIAVSKL